MIQKKIIITLLAFLPFGVFSQSTDRELSKKEIRNSRPSYIHIGLNQNMSKFRDFATSPLFYEGIATGLSVARLKLDESREIEFGSTFSSGKYNATTNNNTTETIVSSYAFHYSRLYQIKKLCSSKWNVKVGGLIDISANMRTNFSLQNNAKGIEMFNNLFGSAKISRDLSSMKRFLFFDVKERKRSLSYRLNVGLMNNSFRNGYAYLSQEDLLNNSNFLDLKDHKFKAFSGSRFSTALDYTVYLKNKNAFQVSYIWDAYKTGGSLDKFEMSNHTLRVSLLFNTK